MGFVFFRDHFSCVWEACYNETFWRGQSVKFFWWVFLCCGRRATSSSTGLTSHKHWLEGPERRIILPANFYIRKKWWPPLNYPCAATGSRSKGSIRPSYIRTVVASKPLSNPLLPAGYFDDHEGRLQSGLEQQLSLFPFSPGQGSILFGF